MLYRAQRGGITAGWITNRNGKVTRAANVFEWAVGKQHDVLVKWLGQKGYQIEKVGPESQFDRFTLPIRQKP